MLLTIANYAMGAIAIGTLVAVIGLLIAVVWEQINQFKAVRASDILGDNARRDAEKSLAEFNEIIARNEKRKLHKKVNRIVTLTMWAFGLATIAWFIYRIGAPVHH